MERTLVRSIHNKLLYFMESCVLGKLCPNCNKDIGIMSVYRAGSPTRIKCPHCKSRLYYKPFPWVLGVVLISIYLAIVLFFADMNIFSSNFDALSFSKEILLIFVLWQPFDLVITLYLRKNAILCVKKI